MAAQVKVRVCGLGLLPPGLNGGPVCDDSTAKVGICSNAALYKLILPLQPLPSVAVPVAKRLFYVNVVFFAFSFH